MLRIILMNEHMNAVDEDDNLVGFSTADDCCAHGGWFVAPELVTSTEKFDALEMTSDQAYEHYVFDTAFFKDGSTVPDFGEDNGVAIFKMIPRGWNLPANIKPLYLHLFNCHNGYYGKGFSYNFNGKKIEGGL